VGREPRRILIVDDDEAIRRLMRVNLELEGFQVDEAPDGERCLAAIHQLRPDLVVLDVAMPGIDGLSVARTLRADPAVAEVKILMVSALARSEDVERGRLAGADAYLTKPFEPDAFVQLIRTLLAADRPADDATDPERHTDATDPGRHTGAASAEPRPADAAADPERHTAAG
jgi:DNA-binding response OmpR family regulator